MFQNEAGIKVYEVGDVVRVGKGKVEWTVSDTSSQDAGYVIAKTEHNTQRAQATDKLTLVRNVYMEWANEDPEIKTEGVTPEHVPGESPNAYKERTGQKLDGRTTRYGRAVLAALQRKAHVFEGKGRGKRRGR